MRIYWGSCLGGALLWACGLRAQNLSEGPSTHSAIYVAQNQGGMTPPPKGYAMPPGPPEGVPVPAGAPMAPKGQGPKLPNQQAPVIPGPPPGVVVPSAPAPSKAPEASVNQGSSAAHSAVRSVESVSNPSGTKQGGSSQEIIKTGQENVLRASDCFSYLSNPRQGDFFLTQNGKFIYFASRTAGEAIQAEPKFYIYEIDIQARTSRRIVGVRLDGFPALVGHGQPLDGATILDLKKSEASCGEGLVGGTGVQWNQQQRIIKNFPNAHYKIVPSDQGTVLADLDQGNVLGFDFVSLQRRTLATFDRKLVPLFVEFQPPKVFALAPERGELLRFAGGSREPESILVLKKGSKLVQSQEWFGLLEQGLDAQKLILRTIKGWSGETFTTQNLDLPKDWVGDQVQLDVSPQTGVALVQAKDVRARRGSFTPQYRKALVYSKSKSTPALELTVSNDAYFGTLNFSLDGKSIFAIVRSLADDGARTLKTWSLEESKWLEDIQLTREVSREAAKKIKGK